MSDSVNLDNLLVAYVDGELDAITAAEVQQMIAVNPGICADVEMFRRTSMLLRAACGEHNYNRRPQFSPTPMHAAGVARRRTITAVAAGAALALAGVRVGVLWRENGEDGSLDDIARYHATLARETEHLAEMGSDRGGEFAIWMSERLGRRLSVPDLLPLGLRYAGGRMLVVDAGTVADFLYTRRQGTPIGVCATRSTGRTAALRLVMRSGLQLATWTTDGLTYVIVGDLDVDFARQIAVAVQGQITA